MKAILKLDLSKPEQRKEHNRCLKSLDYLLALSDVGEEVFRPARKYGYDCEKLNALLDNKLSDEEEEVLEKAQLELSSFVLQNLRNKDRMDKIYNLREKISKANQDKPDNREIVSVLEERFYDILSGRGVDFDDL